MVLYLVSHKDISDKKRDQDPEHGPETGEFTSTITGSLTLNCIVQEDINAYQYEVSLL